MMKLYNTDALKHRSDYFDIVVYFNHPVDIQVMMNFHTLYKDEVSPEKPFAVLVTLYQDYVKRGGHPYEWYKTSAENFALANMLTKVEIPTGNRVWHILYSYLSDGIIYARNYKPVTRKKKDIAIEIARKMKDGTYPDPFQDESLVQKTTIDSIVVKDYPQITNIESFRIILTNEYWSN